MSGIGFIFGVILMHWYLFTMSFYTVALAPVFHNGISRFSDFQRENEWNWFDFWCDTDAFGACLQCPFILQALAPVFNKDVLSVFQRRNEWNWSDF